MLCSGRLQAVLRTQYVLRQQAGRQGGRVGPATKLLQELLVMWLHDALVVQRTAAL